MGLVRKDQTAARAHRRPPYLSACHNLPYRLRLCRTKLFGSGILRVIKGMAMRKQRHKSESLVVATSLRALQERLRAMQLLGADVDISTGDSMWQSRWRCA